jgi:hypothetical protein
LVHCGVCILLFYALTLCRSTTESVVNSTYWLKKTTSLHFLCEKLSPLSYSFFLLLVRFSTTSGKSSDFSSLLPFTLSYLLFALSILPSFCFFVLLISFDIGFPTKSIATSPPPPQTQLAYSISDIRSQPSSRFHLVGFPCPSDGDQIWVFSTHICFPPLTSSSHTAAPRIPLHPRATPLPRLDACTPFPINCFKFRKK